VWHYIYDLYRVAKNYVTAVFKKLSSQYCGKFFHFRYGLVKKL